MIDRKCKVTLGGLPQKIHVKGDETKPVLLFAKGVSCCRMGPAGQRRFL